jgi:serine/threonine protein kinase
MTWLPDAAVERLREVAEWPDFDGTRYEILDRVGSGGMGSVYRARDRELDRKVALKVLSLPDPESAARMIREARVIARLEHPGIVPIHDVGRLPDGRVFYAMKLVVGERLDQLVARGELLPGRLRAFERICEAVAFAHARGVIHRDLKPENVMVGPFGEVLVMDWGLARAGCAPTEAHGAVLGTPGYMAPEQARGDVASVGERSDIYSLGALLRFLLVGAPLPRALDAVCRRAMAAEPEARYATATELAGEVARFLAGDAVLAYREGALGRVWRLARRHRAAVVVISAYLLMRLLLLRF